MNVRQDFVLFSDLDKLSGDNVSYCRNAVHFTANTTPSGKSKISCKHAIQVTPK